MSQQVSRVIEPGAGRCIACNSRADLVEYEKVLKLFFMPVWRWPGEDGPLMHCNSCGLFFPPPEYEDADAEVCMNCFQVVYPELRFCSSCGTAI